MDEPKQVTDSEYWYSRGFRNHEDGSLMIMDYQEEITPKLVRCCIFRKVLDFDLTEPVAKFKLP